MIIEENQYSGNNCVKFTTPEFKKYEGLETIVKRNGGNRLPELIIKTASDILEIVVGGEYLLAERGSFKNEVHLPLIEREYVRQLKFKPFLKEDDSDGETYQEEVDLTDSEFDSLLSLKLMYQKAILSREKFKGAVLEETPNEDTIQEIFEIGLNYLSGLVKLSLQGYTSIRILDQKRKPTSKALNSEGVLINVRTERERALQYEFEVKKAIIDMEIALKTGLENLPIYNKINPDTRVMLDKREMREKTLAQIKKLPTYFGKCADMLSIEERNQRATASAKERKEKDI